MNDLSALAQHFGALARSHKLVTILFLDICGFTSMSRTVPPSEILSFLNNLFTMYDVLADKHNVQKVDTSGDCYIASVGITGSNPDDGGFYQVLCNKLLRPAARCTCEGTDNYNALNTDRGCKRQPRA